ncbi:hypothetical protein [Nonomuraea fuscirosea]|uniref:hypothetical protein n=1 Tax=Nonomuraea fuscirosea TaxID=1291556 RepID=UPI0033C6B504
MRSTPWSRAVCAQNVASPRSVGSSSAAAYEARNPAMISSASASVAPRGSRRPVTSKVRQPAVTALVPRVDGGGQQQSIDRLPALLRPGDTPPNQQILGGLELLGLIGTEPGTRAPSLPSSRVTVSP